MDINRKSCLQHLNQATQRADFISYAKSAVDGGYNPVINQGFFDVLIALSHGYGISRSQITYSSIYSRHPIYFSMICYTLLRLHWINVVKYCRYPLAYAFKLGYTVCTPTSLGKAFIRDMNLKPVSDRLFKNSAIRLSNLRFPTLNNIMKSRPSHVGDLIYNAFCYLGSVSLTNNFCSWVLPHVRSIRFLNVIQFMYNHQNTYNKLEKEHGYSKSIQSLFKNYMFSDRYISF